MADLIHESFPPMGVERPAHMGSAQQMGPASQVPKAVDEAETDNMSRGNFQQAAELESSKRAYSKRMGIGLH